MSDAPPITADPADTGANGAATVLECHGLVAGYHGRAVVRDFNLKLGAGEVVALLGPNGAGKTTTLMTLSGLVPRLGGDVTVLGSSIAAGRSRSLGRSGVVLVPDDRSLFTTLSTKQNLSVARTHRDAMAVSEVLEYFPALKERLGVAAGVLSGGEQQMLALGRGLIQRPKVLLVDELSMGLAPLIVEDLLALLRRIADETATAILLVEQHVRLALDLADRAIVLVHGDTVLADDSARLLADPEIVERAYFGETNGAADDAAPARGDA